MLPMLSIMYTRTTPPCCKKNCCSLLVSVDSDGGYSMGLGLGTVSPREDTTIPGFRLELHKSKFFSQLLFFAATASRVAAITTRLTTGEEATWT